MTLGIEGFSDLGKTSAGQRNRFLKNLWKLGSQVHKAIDARQPKHFNSGFSQTRG